MKTHMLLASAISLLAINPADASTVTGNILADNGSLAVLQIGSSYSVIPTSVAGNWPTLKANFTFNVPDDTRSLAQCRIHVIAWGDGGVAQGIMAHFAGNNGVSYTGQPGSSLNNVAMSTVTFSGGVGAAQTYASTNAGATNIINNLGAPNTGFASQPAASGGIPGTWGPVNLPADMEGRGGVKFVYNEKSDMLNANPNNYRVISLPCQSVAKSAEPQPHVASWEIAGQFNPTNNINTATNPFEVWTYGYTVAADCSGPVIPFKNKGFDPNHFGSKFTFWSLGANGATNSSDLPLVGQREGATLLNPVRYSPKGITMHPGPQGQCAVVRFTVPATGIYKMMGRFWAQNITAGGTNSGTRVMRNGSTSIDARATVTVPSGTTSNPFTWSGALTLGDTIDFMVDANGSFLNDSTGLHGYIQRDD